MSTPPRTPACRKLLKSEQEGILRVSEWLHDSEIMTVQTLTKMGETEDQAKERHARTVALLASPSPSRDRTMLCQWKDCDHPSSTVIQERELCDAHLERILEEVHKGRAWKVCLLLLKANTPDPHQEEHHDHALPPD